MLFVPVRHTPDASAPNGSYDAGLAMETAARYAAYHGVKSFNLITSCGKAATQTVEHLHVHLVPRREGDGLKLPWTGQSR